MPDIVHDNFDDLDQQCGRTCRSAFIVPAAAALPYNVGGAGWTNGIQSSIQIIHAALEQRDKFQRPADRDLRSSSGKFVDANSGLKISACPLAQFAADDNRLQCHVDTPCH